MKNIPILPIGILLFCKYNLFYDTGTQRAVVFSSDKAIRDALFKHDRHFSDRPPSFRGFLLTKSQSDVVAKDSARRRYRKKNMLQSMKNHGAGLKHLESRTLMFGMEMLTEMDKYGCCAFDPFQMIRMTLGKIIMDLTYGYNTLDDVKHFAEIEKDVLTMMKPSGFYMLLDICPPLRFIFPKLSIVHKEFLTLGSNIKETFSAYTNNRKKIKLNNNDESSAIIDHFLTSDLTSGNKAFDEEDLVYIGFDFLIGGVATSSAFLYNLLGILVNHPSIQEKAHTEIKDGIGQRPPTTEDRKNLPYIEAVILECFRYTSLVPVALRHCSHSTTDLNGYYIPGGTFIFPNLWAQNHDEKYWDDPWEFIPKRFLEDGKLVPGDHIKRQRLLAFGGGSRHCTGEAYTKQWLFLLVTLMMQKFKFLPAEGHPAPQHDPREYLVRLNLLIKPFRMSVQSRE